MGKTAAEKRYVRDLNARLPEGVNRCSFCGLFKGDDQFSPAQRWNGSKRKSSYECRTCSTARARRYRAKLPQGKKAEKARQWHLSTLYGMTEECYEKMLSEQDGKCAICRGDDPKHVSGKWNIDHDHSTGKVRRLLCSPCNKGIGHFSDNPALLRAAADYLEAHSGTLD